MPVGTGTLYVVDCETEEAEEANCPSSGTKKQRLNVEGEGERGDPSEGFLRMEKSGLNVTQREESLVVQYLTGRLQALAEFGATTATVSCCCTRP